jgi:hypothetical protein
MIRVGREIARGLAWSHNRDSLCQLWRESGDAGVSQGPWRRLGSRTTRLPGQCKRIVHLWAIRVLLSEARRVTIGLGEINRNDIRRACSCSSIKLSRVTV